MKKLIGILGVILAFVVLYSCTDDNGENLLNEDGTISVDAGSIEIAAEEASSSATVDALLEDIDDLSDVDFAATNTGARTVEVAPDSDDKIHRFGDCLVVTKEIDEETGAITRTIDFGDGCEGARGIVRKGKITIVKSSSRRYEVGHMRTVTFDNFYLDDVKIEGVRTLKVTAKDMVEGTGSITISIKYEGGEVKFPDGTEYKREANRTKIVTIEEFKVVKTEKFGTAEGINRDELAYKHTVLESDPITHLRACLEGDVSVFAPVSGTLTIEVEGEEDRVIDFGDGTCDNLAKVTQGDETVEISINPRHKRRVYRRAVSR